MKVYTNSHIYRSFAYLKSDLPIFVHIFVFSKNHRKYSQSTYHIAQQVDSEAGLLSRQNDKLLIPEKYTR